MKKLPYFLALLFLISSCNKAVKLTKEQEQFIAMFNKELKLPLALDSTFMMSLDTLEAADMTWLERIKKDSLSKELAGDLGNSVAGCLFIEKLQRTGRYAGYVDSLDIGMLKNAMAFKVGRVNLGDNVQLLLWGINEGSYEADPGFSGTSIIASHANNKGGFTHVIVTEEYNAGDPPSFMARRTHTEIKEGELKVNTRVTNQDLDSGSKATETKYLRLEVKDGELSVSQRVMGK